MFTIIYRRQKRYSCPTGPQYSSLSDKRSPLGDSSKALNNMAKMSSSSSTPHSHQQKRGSMMLMQQQTTWMASRNSSDSGCSRKDEDKDGEREIDLNEISTEIDSSMENMKLSNNNNWSSMKKSSLNESEKSMPAEKSKSVKIVKSLKKTIFSKRSGSTDDDNY
uniref:Uncharacterized protein n=1 Tax=Romanomermis culicivorax TaxID=13658 RepID=A0A915JGI4_ROMCU